MSKEAYYFSHDRNARTDPKIMSMIADYKAEGYGLYWCVIEMLREQEEYKLPLNKITFNAIAMHMLCERNAVQNFVEKCICEYFLFESDDVCFWSNSLIKRMEKKDLKSEKARQSAEARWKGKKGSKTEKPSNNEASEVVEPEPGTCEPNANAMQPHSECNANLCEPNAIKEKKRKENKLKENKDIYIEQSEKLWGLYPNKKGKAEAMKAMPKLLKEFGYEQLERCVKRYIEFIEKTHKQLQYVKHGSTFFNGTYVDYLDKNYQEGKENGHSGNDYSDYHFESSDYTDEDLPDSMFI